MAIVIIPSDRYGRARFQPRSQVHGCVDADFRSMSDLRPMKHGGSGGDKHFGVDLSTDHMAVRTNDAVVPLRSSHADWSRG
ncbi:hypothetical protein RvVAR0630_pl01460 (plasmid) [Agrobacterium vitis]|nr:hypothetical protein RvVAR0630_pl01460 [Agrobacterium vitis]